MLFDVSTLTQAFAESTIAKFDVSLGRSTPLLARLKLDEFDADEAVDKWHFRGAGKLLDGACESNTPDTADATRNVARYANKSRGVQWMTAMVFWSTFFLRVIFGTTFQRGSALERVAFGDAD